MYRSQGEKISSMRIITVLPANVHDNFIFFLPGLGAPSIRARGLSTCEKGGNISCVESILYENIQLSLTEREDQFFCVPCYSREKKM